MSELFKGYEQEFIGSLTSINRKIQSISVQTNRTQALNQRRRNWLSSTSRRISSSARSSSSLWRLKSTRWTCRSSSSSPARYLTPDAGPPVQEGLRGLPEETVQGRRGVRPGQKQIDAYGRPARCIPLLEFRNRSPRPIGKSCSRMARCSRIPPTS